MEINKQAVTMSYSDFLSWAEQAPSSCTLYVTLTGFSWNCPKSWTDLGLNLIGAYVGSKVEKHYEERFETKDKKRYVIIDKYKNYSVAEIIVAGTESAWRVESFKYVKDETKEGDAEVPHT